MQTNHEIRRLQLAMCRLVEDFQALGTKVPIGFEFFAAHLPDEEVIYGLWQHLRNLSVRDGVSTAAPCDALTAVIDAWNSYDLESRSWPSRQIRLTRDLAGLARKRPAHEIVELFDRRMADHQRGSELVVALWEGAVAAGLARDMGKKDGLSIKLKGKWKSVGRDYEASLRYLAEEEPTSFCVAALRALHTESKALHRDPFRPLRELVKYPTRRRFVELLEEGNHDDNDLRIYFPILRQAARRFFGGNLPLTWRAQVAVDTAKIKAVAQCAHQLLSPHSKASGPPRDPAQDAYEARLCAIYQRLTGDLVTYSTTWPSSCCQDEGARFGPALTFIHLGLRLIDPGSSVNQARARIDRQRGSLVEDRNKSRRDLRA